MRNIPIPSNNNYKYKLIEKVESVLKRMRWKAIFFDKNDRNEKDDDNLEKNIFKSRKCPSQHYALKAFEDDLLKIIENIKFRKTRNKFQHKLRTDVSRINSSKNVFIPADKTNNHYEISTESYKKALHENITKSYQKSAEYSAHRVNIEAKNIAKDLNIDDRVNMMTNQESFITIKDHKEDFNVNPKYRLLNPAKSNLGKVSKSILERIQM